MKIHLEFETYQQMIDFCNQMVPAAETKKPRKSRKKTEPAKTEEPAATVETPTTYNPEDEAVTEEPAADAETAVTRDQLMAYIQENCADNIQPLKDMLDRMGYARVSLIPDEKLGEALATLKGE